MSHSPHSARLHASRLTSTRHDWRTPRALFAALDREFSFTLDAAASRENALCSRWFSARDNALWQNWTQVAGAGAIWLNPPYGGDVGRFMQKAYLSSTQGATVVCLVPARTDVGWWHAWAMRAAEIRFIRGRVQFDDCGTGAPFPSVLVIFRAGCMGPPTMCSWSAAGGGKP